ncbi:MAG TPA: DUF2272 domain-containing protein [Longimicrobiales bacterium]|nr:DUF2272 domain-containing protein [Longimicrobiales bacterium]
MKTLTSLLALALLSGGALPAAAQPVPERLPRSSFDVTPPSDRVQGSLSRMRVVDRTCREAPLSSSELRRRIVDISVQEWAFFGFPVLDRLNGARLLPGQAIFENTTRRAPTPGAQEGERVAATIAGYWAVTPEGPGIVAEQARRWSARGAGTRWNAPWSAAFISWVMCEAGLGTQDQFRRAIAHWTYVDQAIVARDGEASEAGYEAYEIGERPVEPGDLLCSSRRPRYASLAERRRQMGQGASSHCDVVVEVDPDGERILAIGGNVLRAVSLKVLPAELDPDGGVRARRTSSAPLYAHLKLRADPLNRSAFRESAVLAALAATGQASTPSPASRVLAALRVEGPWSEQRDGR